MKRDSDPNRHIREAFKKGKIVSGRDEGGQAEREKIKNSVVEKKLPEGNQISEAGI